MHSGYRALGLVCAGRGPPVMYHIPAATPLSDVVWRLHIPLNGQRVSGNDRGRFKGTPIPRNSDATAQIRRLAGLAARQAHLPKGLELVKVDMAFHEQPGRGRIRDISNYAPTAKALLDGLTDYGLIPNDSDTYVVGPHLWRGADMPRGGHAKRSVTILIVEIEPLKKLPYTPIDEESPTATQR